MNLYKKAISIIVSICSLFLIGCSNVTQEESYYTVSEVLSLVQTEPKDIISSTDEQIITNVKGILIQQSDKSFMLKDTKEEEVIYCYLITEEYMEDLSMYELNDMVYLDGQVQVKDSKPYIDVSHLYFYRNK
jgi:hypothetical protein